MTVPRVIARGTYRLGQLRLRSAVELTDKDVTWLVMVQRYVLGCVDCWTDLSAR